MTNGLIMLWGLKCGILDSVRGLSFQKCIQLDSLKYIVKFCGCIIESHYHLEEALEPKYIMQYRLLRARKF